MCAVCSRRFFVSTARTHYGGPDMSSTQAKDFKMYALLLVCSIQWLEVVKAWVFECGIDALLVPLGCESGSPCSMLRGL